MTPNEGPTEREPDAPRVLAPPPALGGHERRILLLEVILVQLVAWGWAVPWNAWVQAGPPENAQPVAAEAVVATISTVLFNGAAAALILYLLWRTAGSLAPAGLAPVRWWRELVSALVIFVAAAVLVAMAALAADMMRLSRWPSDAPPEGSKTPLFALVLLAGAVLEEVCFRAYLITRLEQLLGRGGWAVVISAILFAVYHTPSPARALELLAAGLVLGVAFLNWRRLPRLVVAHWAWNLVIAY